MLLRYPEKIPCDKRLHALIGVVYVSVLTLFTSNLFIIILSLIILSWGIEFYQKWTKTGQYDNYDALAVLVGGLIVYLSRLI